MSNRELYSLNVIITCSEDLKEEKILCQEIIDKLNRELAKKNDVKVILRDKSYKTCEDMLMKQEKNCLMK